MTEHDQSSEAGASRSRGLRVALWVVQALLAAVFGMAGFMKLATPYPELAEQMTWVNHVPPPLVNFIGVMELAGAIGIVLPSATRTKPFLTPLAAAGLAVIMVLAAGLHVTIGEAPVPNLILGALAAFVAWGRFKKAPIPPRPGG